MLPKVWSSLWKVKIQAEGRPEDDRLARMFKKIAMSNMILTSVDFNVDLVLAGAEQNRLIAVCDIAVSFRNRKCSRSNMVCRKQKMNEATARWPFNTTDTSGASSGMKGGSWPARGGI